MKKVVRVAVVSAIVVVLLLWSHLHLGQMYLKPLQTSGQEENGARVDKVAANLTRESIVPSGLGYRYQDHTRQKAMPERFKTEPNPPNPNDTHLKIILLWNDWYGKPHYGFGLGHEPFVAAGCKVNTCLTTSNRSLYPSQSLDALIWHFRAKDKTFPVQRSPHTRYVFWMAESPQHLFGDLEAFDGVFNWTFTYRLDSDFPSPYGFVRRRSLLHQEPGDGGLAEKVVAGKTKMVAWFVSNCDSSSGRESLARTLKQYIPVDIYGKCGPYRCVRSHQSRCYDMLQRDYKFYLAFENSLCRDYITEKFFNVLEYYVVPVVWGLGNYTSQAPSHSFVDASSFLSVQELARYLLYLDANHTAYMEYFQWKEREEALSGWKWAAEAWCNLCERLHTDASTKVYHNLHSWFVKGSSCRSATERDIARYVHGELRYPDSHSAE